MICLLSTRSVCSTTFPTWVVGGLASADSNIKTSSCNFSEKNCINTSNGQNLSVYSTTTSSGATWTYIQIQWPESRLKTCKKSEFVSLWFIRGVVPRREGPASSPNRPIGDQHSSAKRPTMTVNVCCQFLLFETFKDCPSPR